MRYRLTTPGAYPIVGSSPGEVQAQRYMGVGTYLTPGSVTSPSSYYGERLSGFGDTTDSTGTTDSSSTGTPSWLQNLVTGITQFAVGRQQMQTVEEINQINIQRAAAGLPPINPNIMQPGVSVGLSPDVQNLLLYGALGVGALIVLNMFLKR